MLIHAIFLKVDSTIDKQAMAEVFTQMGKDSTEEALEILNGWIKEYPSDLNARALRVLLMDGLDSDREYGLKNKDLLISGITDANMLIKY